MLLYGEEVEEETKGFQYQEELGRANLKAVVEAQVELPIFEPTVKFKGQTAFLAFWYGCRIDFTSVE
jgi:hypothetical protein